MRLRYKVKFINSVILLIAACSDNRKIQEYLPWEETLQTTPCCC